MIRGDLRQLAPRKKLLNSPRGIEENPVPFGAGFFVLLDGRRRTDEFY
jgi:hypothetical protein